jgi:hypothetical protein
MVHISPMANTDDNIAEAAPRYRQRMPVDASAAPQSVQNAADSASQMSDPQAADAADDPNRPKELGGPKGPEPTRFGDWERDGRCVDF